MTQRIKKGSRGRDGANFGIVLVTCSSADEGEKMARGLVVDRLAACVNMVKNVDSLFWWEGKVDHAQEVLLVIKTQKSRFSALESYVKAHHSYQVPEMIFLPIATGHGPYLNWIRDSLRG